MNMTTPITPDRKWHKGPPPHIGWWNASSIGYHEIWRWWDGKRWSQPASDHHLAEKAAYKAQRQTSNAGIEWTHYYPANARVPRVDPSKSKA